MKRTLAFLAALTIAVSYTLLWSAPAVRGQLGPCAVLVHCPETQNATRYYYELEGSDLYRSIRVDYRPGETGEGAFRDLPPGDYVLRCDGIRLGSLRLTLDEPSLELFPNESWPVFPPK